MLSGLRPTGPQSWSQLFAPSTLFGWSPYHGPEKLRETAWLDGLRGVAAFLVMIYHFNITMWNTFYIEAPFGATTIANDKLGVPGGRQLWHFWRLPFFRIWMCSGHAQVSVFFVLSGFVLSWGPLGLIQAGRHDKVLQSLGSATFRRWIRLFLPCFAIALWQCLEMWFGLRDMGPIERRSNIFAQLWDFVEACESFANPFKINRDNNSALHRYDWTMWTIPYEYAGSLLIFTMLLAVCRFSSYVKRTIAISIVVAYACLRAEWNFFLFSTGMLIANYVKNAGGFDNLSQNTGSRLYSVSIVMLVVGMILAGLPSNSDFYSRPGYAWLDNLIPSNWLQIEGGERWWWCWAGILFIFGACHVPAARRFFEFSFVRYLGRVSYMLYLTHRIVLNLMGGLLRAAIYALFGRETWINDGAAGGTILHPVFTLLAYLLMLSALIPTCLVVANLVETLIDRPSTRLARRVDEWFLGASKDSANSGENSSLLPTWPTEQAHEAPEIELLNSPDHTRINGNAR